MSRLNFEDIDYEIDTKSKGGSDKAKKEVESIDNLDKNTQRGGSEQAEQKVETIDGLARGGNSEASDEPVRDIENEDLDSTSVSADESDFDPGDYVMGGNQTVVSSRPVKSGRKAMPGSDMANMRLPRSLLNIIKTEFPSASNQDALAAYILVKSGEDVSVSPTVDILVENYKGDKTVQNIDKRVEHMEKQLNEMRTMLNEVLLAVSYLVFDRVGFRNENPSDPRSINFIENGMADLQQRLSEQSVQLKQYKDRKKGRPLR